MKTFKYFCNQRESYYKKLNEVGPAAPATPPAGTPPAGTPPAAPPQSKTLPLVQKGMTDMQAAMQKNPADPNLAKMAQDLTKNLTAWQQELAQAAKAPAPGTPPAAGGTPPATPGAPPAKAPGT